MISGGPFQFQSFCGTSLELLKRNRSHKHLSVSEYLALWKTESRPLNKKSQSSAIFAGKNSMTGLIATLAQYLCWMLKKESFELPPVMHFFKVGSYSPIRKQRNLVFFWGSTGTLRKGHQMCLSKRAQQLAPALIPVPCSLIHCAYQESILQGRHPTRSKGVNPHVYADEISCTC